jgi:PadR family transcriptional regulator PadR
LEEISRQLKKGVLDILLLKLLEKRALYGYELMSLLDRESKGYFALKEGTLYPVLYRLEDAGHVSSFWEKEQTRRGAQRKYYAITDQGRAYLAAAQEELALLIRSIVLILGGDVG